MLAEWLRTQIAKRPGVATKWLFDNRPSHSASAAQFDGELEQLRAGGGVRVANSRWWPTGYVGHRKPPRAGKPAHPRQLDMFAAPAQPRKRANNEP